MQFDESTSKTITLKLAPHEFEALRERARKEGRTVQDEALKLILLALVRANLITESAERDGWKVSRMDE